MAEINNEIPFKSKEAGISCFCQKKSVCTKRSTKKMFSDSFDHKLTDTKEGSVKQEDGGL